MGNPKVNVVFGASNLGISAADASGIFGLMASVLAAPTAGYGVPFLIKSKAQAKAAFADPLNVGILKAITDGFYGEVSEGSPLYITCFAATTSLATMADIANTNVGALNNFSGKKLRAIGLVRFPASNYVPTIIEGFDGDVHDAVIKAQEQATAWIQQYKPLEFLVEGRSFTDATTAKDYTVTINKNVHIAIGSEGGNSAISVLRALGKKAANAVHRNFGRVKSGSLNIAQDAVVVLGQKLVSTTTPETKATAIITITGAGGAGLYLNMLLWDKYGYLYPLFNYPSTAADTTAMLVATGIVAAINAATPQTGCIATNVAGVVTITLKAGLGASYNTRPLYTNGSSGITFAITPFTGGVDAVVVNTPQLLTTYDKTDLDTLHDKGYMTYIANEDAPGFIFNDDVSLTTPTSDYATWSHNAVIGEAMRIAYAQYYKTLKDDVEVDDLGTLGKAVETNFAQDIMDAINKQLAGSISGVNAVVNPSTTASAGLYANANIVNPNLNLLQAGKLFVFLTIRPRGYIKDVMVVLGFGL